jgi:hypothetical protein
MFPVEKPLGIGSFAFGGCVQEFITIVTPNKQ